MGFDATASEEALERCQDPQEAVAALLSGRWTTSSAWSSPSEQMGDQGDDWAHRLAQDRLLREEQDREYEASLAADRARTMEPPAEESPAEEPPAEEPPAEEPPAEEPPSPSARRQLLAAAAIRRAASS